MKALSLKQPWAELIVSGRKKIEIRSWNTKFRGEFLIHSSKIPDKNGMKKFGFGDELPLGKIVGKAKLINVKKYENEGDFDKDKDLHLAKEGPNCYGFILEDIERVKKIECNGKLGFWNFEESEKCLSDEGGKCLS